MFKKLHLWLSNNYSKIKHVLLGILGITLLVFSMVVIAGQNRLITQVKDLSEQNKILAQQNKDLNTQAKSLGEENKSIAKQSRSFVLCGFQVFAEFTRTQQPIANLDLEACTKDSQSKATNNTSTNPGNPDTSNSTSPESSSSSSTAVPSSSSNNSIPNNPNPSDNSQKPIKVGPIPVCIPFTKVCATR